MIGGIITSGLRLAVAAGITKVAETVFTKLVKPKQSTDDDKTILPSSTAKNIIKDILDLKNPVVIPENTDKKLVQQFLLKLGVHVTIKDNKIEISENNSDKLRNNINHIEAHLEKFYINPQQISFVISDLANQFQNFIKKTSGSQKESDALKKDRIANKIVNILNHNDNDNPLDASSYIEGIRLEKLVEPFTQNDSKSENNTVTSGTVLQTILHADVFGQNKDKNITYQEFNEKIRLPKNVGISESDFDGFQKGTKEMLDSFDNYKTTIKKSDVGTDIKPLSPPTGVKVLLNYEDFFSGNAPLDENHKKYIRDNAHNIFIKVDDTTQLLKAYKKLKDIDKDSKVNFTNKDDDTASASKLDDLFKFIQKFSAPFEGTNEKLIFDAIKANTQDTKDNAFKAIINNKNTYDAIKSEYPDFMKVLFAKEMAQHTKLGEFIPKKEITDIFDALKSNEFNEMKNKSDIIQKHLYSDFFKSDAYKNLPEVNKLSVLEAIKENINNIDLNFLIDDAFKKLKTDTLDNNNPNVKKIIANKEINSFFDKNYNIEKKSNQFNIQIFLLGDNVLQKGKQDRYDIYSAFIKKNELDINTHLNLDTPQGLAKLILALKLIPELEGLKKINAVTDNDKINQNIEKLSKKLATSDTTKINDALKKHLPDSKDIKTDTITADQLQKLLNSF